MATIGETIYAGYTSWNKVETLSKGEYMMQLRPGVYKNTDSARRAYDKLVGNYTSGERVIKDMYGAHPLYGPPEKPYRARAGRLEGIWSVRATFTYTDIDPQTGKKRQDTRTWTAVSSQYSGRQYTGYVRAAVENLVQYRLNRITHGEVGTDINFDPNYEAVEIDVYPAETSRSRPEAEGGNLINLDYYDPDFQDWDEEVEFE